MCCLYFLCLELLERVLFRLGTTDTDEQLEVAVNKFLTPVLLKITSPHESVRCKVSETNDEITNFLFIEFAYVALMIR